MIKRKIEQELLKWKSTPHHKALLIKGARQVGKTTIVRQFAKDNYKNFIEINFEKMPVAKEAFNGNLDAQTIIMNLSAMGFGPFEAGETLIFFDEIQTCGNARTAIKFLVEDGRFDYIESGSLLGINYKDVSSYPVGFEHQIDMYPLDLQEFLSTSGISDDIITLVHDCYIKEEKVPDFLHNQLMERLMQYIVIGGMPEVVAQFIATHDFNDVVRIQNDILNSYRDDISKYSGNYKHLTKKIFDSIPSQLSKQDKRFILAELEKGASMRKYAAPTEWLIDAGIAYFCTNINALALPTSQYEKSNLFKLYMVDTGLVSHFILRNIQYRVLQGEIEINEGALAENFVAAELKHHGVSLNYYDKKSKQELDFVIQENNGLTILEVKSGNDYKKHASLNAAIAREDIPLNRAIVLSKYNVERDRNILYLPLYMTMFISN